MSGKKVVKGDKKYLKYCLGVMFCLFVFAVIYDVFVHKLASAENKDYIKAIESGIEKLESNSDYIISCADENFQGILHSLEVVHNGDSYVEFPVDEDGNIVSSEFGESASQTYALSEWHTSDNMSYMFTGDGTIYRLPKGYADIASGRKNLYVRDLIASAYNIEKEDSEVLTIMGVQEKFDIYSMKVPSDVVQTLVGMQTLGVYDGILKDEGADSSLGKLCSYYIDELSFELACSDANLLVGLNTDGVLRYMSMEIGGNGSRSYITRVVMAFDNSSVRTLPDISSAIDFSTTLVDLAEFVSSYDSYDDAVDALNSMEDTLSESEIDIEEEEVLNDE